MSKTTNHTAAGTEVLDALVVAAEQVPPGEPWAKPHADALDAIAGAVERARAQLSPSGGIRPTAPGLLGELDFYLRRLGANPSPAAMASLHARCLAEHPALAEQIRIHGGREVGAAAARKALPDNTRETHGEVQARASEAAIATFEQAIARQLAVLPDHELAPAARTLIDCAAFAQRLSAVRARQEAHVAMEITRAETERREAEAARQAELGRKREEAETEAKRLERLAVAGKRDARRARAEHLAERLRASKLEDLRSPSGGIWSVESLVRNLRADHYDHATIDQFEEALAAMEPATATSAPYSRRP